MSIFSKILEKLGLKKGAPAAPTTGAKPGATTGARPGTSAPSGPATTTRGPAPAPGPISPTTANRGPSAPVAISEVDVVKQLEQRAAGSGLNWKVSIVDLLKLLDIDSSREARNELAQELGCPPELMHDSAKMNVWLHKTVLKKIAENGGNIPQSLLD